MVCPFCGTEGARKSQDRIHCSKPGCIYYHAAPEAGTTTPAFVAPSPRIQDSRSDWNSGGSADRQSCLAIQYVNFRKETRTFQVESASIRRRNNHILARERRSGRQITLCRDRIQNMAEVDALLPARDRSGAPRPNSRERQVLGYHSKHKTTSPLYEKIKARYPDW